MNTQTNVGSTIPRNIETTLRTERKLENNDTAFFNYPSELGKKKKGKKKEATDHSRSQEEAHAYCRLFLVNLRTTNCGIAGLKDLYGLLLVNLRMINCATAELKDLYDS